MFWNIGLPRKKGLSVTKFWSPTLWQKWLFSRIRKWDFERPNKKTETTLHLRHFPNKVLNSERLGNVRQILQGAHFRHPLGWLYLLKCLETETAGGFICGNKKLKFLWLPYTAINSTSECIAIKDKWTVNMNDDGWNHVHHTTTKQNLEPCSNLGHLPSWFEAALAVIVIPQLCTQDSPGRSVLKIHFSIESGPEMIQFKIQFKTKSGIFIQKNIHSIESRIFNRIIH